MPPRIHDLLEIDAEGFLQAHSPVPAWVAESLRHTPFVVVRRGPVSEEEIPVGVRGAPRNERWAGSCHPGLVKEVLTPQTLLRRATTVAMAHAAPQLSAAAACVSAKTTASARAATIPALRALALLAERWKALDVEWGPGGSVGFELATGRQVVTPQSDLDVVIHAHTQMTVNEARTLRDATQGLPAQADIRVETPICGFSLVEYARRAPAPILLRTAPGTFLGADPWMAQGATGVPQHVVTRAVPPVAEHR
jgi:phosphoribosyl-dephospho-CoA transferase